MTTAFRSEGRLAFADFPVLAPTSVDYQQLADMEVPGVGPLSVHDREVLMMIARILVEAGAHKHFGVIHLHRHLEFVAGEVLVRERKLDLSGMTTRPVILASLDGYQPVSYRVVANGDGYTALALEVESVSSAPTRIVPQELLAKIGTLLEAEGKLLRFGIGHLRDDDMLQGDDAFVETTDLDLRVMDMTIGSPNFEGMVPTQWHFDLVDDVIIVAGCKRCCWDTGPNGGHVGRHHNTN